MKTVKLNLVDGSTINVPWDLIDHFETDTLNVIPDPSHWLELAPSAKRAVLKDGQILELRIGDV